jgi:hypothetical protein
MKTPWVISLILLMLAGSLGLTSCRQPGGQETALITGAVTIGPITPVEQPGQCPPVSPEVFTSRKIMIYDDSGEKLVREVSITQIGQTASGYYTVLVAPGTYTIDINRLGIDHADGLPKKVTISANQTVTVDINIDTGIR